MVSSFSGQLKHLRHMSRQVNYLNVVLNDMDRIMPYKTGSTQYVSETLVKGENIRLYS